MNLEEDIVAAKDVSCVWFALADKMSSGNE
jgi:hypothetical protein